MMKVDCMRIEDEPKAGRKSRDSERAATKAAHKEIGTSRVDDQCRAKM